MDATPSQSAVPDPAPLAPPEPLERLSALRVARTAGPSFLLLGFLGRLPLAMLPLGLLLLVSRQTGSFAVAGTAVAGLSLGGAAGGIGIGHLADRYGHRRVGLLAALALAVCLGLLLAAARLDAPVSLLVGLAALTGLVNPQIGSFARTRWLATAAACGERGGFTSAAMGYESAVDEISFVLGPVLVGVAAAVASPADALLAALGLALVSQLGFALHPSAIGLQQTSDKGKARVRLPAVLPLAAVVACVGLVFGASQTGVAARLAATGQEALTGPVYGAMGAGSAISALLVGRLLARVAPWRRILGAALGLAAMATLLALATNPVLLALTCLLVGLCVAPVLVGAYALVERIAPSTSNGASRTTTVMTVLATATVGGVAAGATASGMLIDTSGPTAALFVGVAAGLLAALAAIGLRGVGARP